jgi:hypothetical protein
MESHGNGCLRGDNSPEEPLNEGRYTEIASEYAVGAPSAAEAAFLALDLRHGFKPCRFKSAA